MQIDRTDTTVAQRFRSRRISAFHVAVIGLALCLLAACGTARGRQEAVAAAATKAPRLNTFSFEMTQEVIYPDFLPVTYEMTGKYVYPDRVWTDITTHVGPDVRTSFTVIRFGKGYYLRIPDEVRILLPGTREWLAGKVDELERSRFLGLFPREAQDITQTLSLLHDASESINRPDHTAIEKKALNYVSHYKFQFDGEKLTDSAAMGRHGNFEAGGGEIWVGVDDLVRQLHFVLFGPARFGGAVRVDIKANITDHNADLTFRVPRQEKVTSFEEFKEAYPKAATGVPL